MNFTVSFFCNFRVL